MVAAGIDFVKMNQTHFELIVFFAMLFDAYFRIVEADVKNHFGNDRIDAKGADQTRDRFFLINLSALLNGSDIILLR